jgi:hypothetical protein
MNKLQKIIFFILIGTKVLYSQTEYEANKNFHRLKNELDKSITISNLLENIDSIKNTFNDQINNKIILTFDRDIDFCINHKRIIIIFELWEYQIDLLSKNDTIYLKNLKTEHFNKLKFEYANKKYLKEYLVKRNELYDSNKNIKNLVDEISINDFFAIRCGDGQEFTKFGKSIYNYSKKLRFKKLKKLLENFNCEMQSFGVAGFEMINKKNIIIPKKYELLIKHIKNRNSEITICSGSLVGLVEKIY